MENRNWSLLSVEHRVSAWVVVHLHLLVYLHVLASGFYVGYELVDGSGEVFLLLEEHVELVLAELSVLKGSIGSIHLLFHVVYLEGED